MANLHLVARRTWRSLPEPIKNFVRKVSLLDSLKRGIRRVTGTVDPHNALYDDNYFGEIERLAKLAEKAIVKSIVTELHPASVLDVGCGTGTFMDGLRSNGVRVFGLEYSESALDICKRKGLAVRQFDLTSGTLDLDEKYDLAVSTEVAEHLPESCADRFVDLLCKASDVVVFTAATPGQGGDGHINEQPHDYWLAKFADRHFVLDSALSEKWQAEWRKQDVPKFFADNLMIMRRRSNGAR